MTNDELAAHLMDLKASQARTEATVVALNDSVTRRLDQQDARQNTQGGRIRDLEKGRWITVGVAGTLSALGTWILTHLPKVS